ncbi:hypothetical protein LAZ67_18000776 [Cordylochernes scorpioides]|uniref:Ileal sodium/bile acid cotransporter n=1 Tax=Cordylochernes scorpioides TaxID=51811 RepID=A0ABY6LHS1_9ARAC|nr:hypothetical protein LAZ67_18000776 [Cordylochernes scorpioides]
MVCQVWGHVRRPVGVAIGLVCQFIMIPLFGFSLAALSSLEPRYAVGMLIISCCPGGTVSNIFTFYVDGDVSLSITMTTFSVFVALGAMPANLAIYGSGLNLSVPYFKILASLATVTAPALVGMAVRWKWPKLAGYITKVGGVISFMIISIFIGMEVVVFSDTFLEVPAKVYVILAVMPIAGCGLGYLAAWLARQSVQVCKTVAIESGVQNSAIALSVIFMSYSFKVYTFSFYFYNSDNNTKQ